MDKPYKTLNLTVGEAGDYCLAGASWPLICGEFVRLVAPGQEPSKVLVYLQPPADGGAFEFSFNPKGHRVSPFCYVLNSDYVDLTDIETWNDCDLPKFLVTGPEIPNIALFNLYSELENMVRDAQGWDENEEMSVWVKFQ